MADSTFNVDHKEIVNGAIFKYAIYFAGPSKKTSSIPKRLLAPIAANGTSRSSSHSLCSRSSSISDESNADISEVSDSEIDLDSDVYYADSLEGYEEYIVFYEEEVNTSPGWSTGASTHHAHGGDASRSNIATFENFNTSDESNDNKSESGEYTGKFNGKGAMKKKVRFSPSPEIRVMHTWKFAHSQARINPHRFSYIDRLRFQEKVRNTELILIPVLDMCHRETIFTERFRVQSEVKD